MTSTAKQTADLSREYIKGYEDCLQEIIIKLKDSPSLDSFILFSYFKKGEILAMKHQLDDFEDNIPNYFDEACLDCQCATDEQCVTLDTLGLEPLQMTVIYGKVEK